MFDLPQEGEKNIPSIDYAQRFEVLADDRNVQKAPFFHDGPDVLQQVVWTAMGHIRGHHRSNRCGATTAMTVTDTPNNIRLGDDINHCAAIITDDNKIGVPVTKKCRGLDKQSVVPDRNETFACDRKYSLDKHHILFLLPIDSRTTPTRQMRCAEWQ